MSQPDTSWHPASTGDHQGLVIDDATGATIAVAYDKKHAPLIAAAPQLLKSCIMLVEWLRSIRSEHQSLVIEHGPEDDFTLKDAERIIQDATA